MVRELPSSWFPTPHTSAQPTGKLSSGAATVWSPKSGNCPTQSWCSSCLKLYPDSSHWDPALFSITKPLLWCDYRNWILLSFSFSCLYLVPCHKQVFLWSMIPSLSPCLTVSFQYLQKFLLDAWTCQYLASRFPMLWSLTGGSAWLLGQWLLVSHGTQRQHGELSLLDHQILITM